MLWTWSVLLCLDRTQILPPNSPSPLSFSFFSLFHSSPVSLLTIPFFTFSAAPFGECAGEEDKTWKRWRAVSLPWLEQHWLHSYLLTIHQPFLKYSRSFCVCVYVCLRMCIYTEIVDHLHISGKAYFCVCFKLTCGKCRKGKGQPLKKLQVSRNEFKLHSVWNLRLQIASLTLSWLHIKCQASPRYFICLHWQDQQAGSLALPIVALKYTLGAGLEPSNHM